MNSSWSFTIKNVFFFFFYSFSYWSLGEPNNYEGRQEDCVELLNRVDKKGWNDLFCEIRNFYMCEKRIFP